MFVCLFVWCWASVCILPMHCSSAAQAGNTANAPNFNCGVSIPNHYKLKAKVFEDNLALSIKSVGSDLFCLGLRFCLSATQNNSTIAAIQICIGIICIECPSNPIPYKLSSVLTICSTTADRIRLENLNQFFTSNLIGNLGCGWWILSSRWNLIFDTRHLSNRAVLKTF